MRSSQSRPERDPLLAPVANSLAAKPQENPADPRSRCESYLLPANSTERHGNGISPSICAFLIPSDPANMSINTLTFAIYPSFHANTEMKLF